MTPTLFGRIQTRIFALLVIGGIWTVIITPLLPGGGALSDMYEATFTVLVVVTVVGIVWEFLYHGLQQFRWEKDWPTFFGYITGVNEGIVAWLIIDAGLTPNEVMIPGNAFLIHFISTWLVVNLFLNGPMRVPFIRWRFKGGRLI